MVFPVHGELPTTGAELTIIDFRRRSTKDSGIVHRDEHVAVGLDEVVEATTQPVVENREVHTYVVAVDGLPGSVVRSHAADPQGGLLSRCDTKDLAAGADACKAFIVADAIDGTRLTIVVTYFQVVEPLDVPYPLFSCQAPVT